MREFLNISGALGANKEIGQDRLVCLAGPVAPEGNSRTPRGIEIKFQAFKSAEILVNPFPRSGAGGQFGGTETLNAPVFPGKPQCFPVLSSMTSCGAASFWPAGLTRMKRAFSRNWARLAAPR